MAPPQKSQVERVNKKAAAPAQTGTKNQGKALQGKMMINGYIISAAETGNPSVLLETIEQHLPSMNDINLATALHRVAKSSTCKGSKDLQFFTSSPTLKQLYETVSKRILDHSLRKGGTAAFSGSRRAEMPVPTMGVIAWSCAMMKMRDEELFSAIADIAAPRMHELQPFELAQMLWSFAKIGLSAPALFEAAARRVLHRQAGEFKGLSLAMTAWAFAAAGVRNEVLFCSLAAELVQHADDLRPQELSDTLWACAEMNIDCPALFESFGWAVASKVKVLKLQELADALWALGAAGHTHAAVFAQASPVIMQKRGVLTPQNIANLAFAYEKLRVPELHQVLPALLETAASKFSKFQACDLTKTLVAGVQAEMVSADFVGRLARHCSHKLLQDMLSEMPTGSLLDMLTLWSRAIVAPPRLFDAAVQESLSRCSTLDAPMLIKTLRCALSISMNPLLASRTGPAWIAAASDELARGVAELTTADAEQLKAIMGEFYQSPAISAVLPLQIALGGGAASPKPQQKFDSDTTVVSTRCPSDCSTEDRDLLAKQLWSSVMKPSGDDVWASMRKQSSAKEQARLSGPSNAMAVSPAVQVNIAAPPGLAPPPGLVTPPGLAPNDYESARMMTGPASPGQTTACEVTKTSLGAFFEDADIFGEEAQVSTSLSSWVAQRCAQETSLAVLSAKTRLSV